MLFTCASVNAQIAVGDKSIALDYANPITYAIAEITVSGTEQLDKQALILWGDSDGIFPEPFAHAFHNIISNSKLEIYKDCGHVPMLEARERFLQRLTDFIQMLT